MRFARLQVELEAWQRGVIAVLLDVAEDAVQAAWEGLQHSTGGYTSFQLKRLRGRDRTITVPTTALKHIQRRILDRIIHVGPVSANAFAGIAGRSWIDAARRHLEPGRSVLHLDIQSAFESTGYAFVARAFRTRLKTDLWLAGLDAGERRQIAGQLAYMVTIRRGQFAPPHERRQLHPAGARCLPLGAPTSVGTLNLVLMHADRRLTALAANGGDGRYTRYVDDMVISSTRALPDPADVQGILRPLGYQLNPEKTVRYDDTPEVHGLQLAASGELMLGPEAQQRMQATIEQAAGRLQRTTSADVRRRLTSRLRGIDNFLTSIYGYRRPASLQINLTEDRSTEVEPVRSIDELWY